MGTVFKKTTTRKLPAGAVVVTKGGVRVARWTVRGKVRTAPLTSGTDGTDRIRTKAATYTAKYRDHTGKVVERPTGCRDEQAARQVLAKWERKVELIRSGVITPEEDAASRHHTAPVEIHFAAFEVRQQARGVADKYQHNTMQALRRVANDCKFRTLADLRCEPFEKWLTVRAAETMSARTRNAYREAWVVFGNWCVESGRLTANPLLNLPKANVHADRRRQRRALTEDELRRLLEVARTRPLHARLAVNRGKRKGEPGAKLTPEFRARLERDGRERALIWKTLVTTGLRKNELASITVGRLRLADPPHIELRAADEKNRKGALLPLRADVADDLRQWVCEKLNLAQAEARDHGKPIPKTRPGDTPLFAVPVHLARALKADLKAAGIPHTDDRGFVVDAHALRGTFATLLAKGGTNPRIVQELMRHSDPRLTANVYTTLRLTDTRGALDSLPALALTDSVAPPVAPTRCNAGHSGSSAGTVTRPGESEDDVIGTAKNPKKGNKNGPLTTAVISGTLTQKLTEEVAAVGFEAIPTGTVSFRNGTGQIGKKLDDVRVAANQFGN
jgi:integrase